MEATSELQSILLSMSKEIKGKMPAVRKRSLMGLRKTSVPSTTGTPHSVLSDMEI